MCGTVQGVGFRPFVYRTALREGLAGFVANTPSGVVVEAEGGAAALGRFRSCLAADAPALARIASVEEVELVPQGEQSFRIDTTRADGDAETLVPPDIALCADCRRELLDAADRRYRYPFTNCTNCGPRYTIVERIPYDRPFTAMKEFAMCPQCDGEYHDPLDRRFHAQPNACAECGPSLSLLDAAGAPLASDDPFGEAGALLAAGRILAIKGVGGFHLAVDAANADAVALLRERKGREEKPFAVMVRDLASAERFCFMEPAERELLSSPEAPIVLLRRRDGTPIADGVAPGNDRLGLMLPYSPLHLLLMASAPEALVLTSANVSEEPIVSDNDEAVVKLSGLADAFLMHDRPIAVKCDDSVAIVAAGRSRLLRRSRGYVPAPITLRHDGPPLLATGGELKATLALLKGRHAILSQHIGDMKNYEAYRHFEALASHLQRIFSTEAELLVHDLHPDYMTTRWALGQGKPTFGVQHHHAHLASCLAEHGHDGPAIGLTLDGTGYGIDGTVWGGEVLVGDASGATRFASLGPMPLPGGDAATRQVWRTALGWLHRSGAPLEGLPPLFQPQAQQVLELLDKGVGMAESSSCGRLFDAVASICGLRHEALYEGQAAIELMQAARGKLSGHRFDFGIERCDGRLQLSVAPLIRDVARAVRSGADAGEVASRFHSTLVAMFSEITRMASRETGLKTVVLSGGVFQNILLAEALCHELETAGFTLLLHQQIPPNDGGLSLGQAVIGREYLRGRYRGVTAMD